MSEQDKKKNLITEIRLTPKEYYNFRDLALKHSVPFTHEWKNGGCTIHVETPFLIAYGYLEMIEF